MPSDSSASDEILVNQPSFSDFVFKNRLYLAFVLLGSIFLGSGFLLYRNFNDNSKLEVVDTLNETTENSIIFVEIAGAVQDPGVYSLSGASRVEDLLVKSGGLSGDADRVWLEKYINRAAKLMDGQKIYIPRQSEHSDVLTANNSTGEDGTSLGTSTIATNPININTASLEQLDSLSGIGPVYAQSIIDHRPYSSTEELVSKGALKSFVYEKIKDRVSVY